MLKLASTAAVGFALGTMGCQPAPAPAQAPQGGTMAAPPPAGPSTCGPEMMMGHHHEGPGGFEGHADAREHHEDGDRDEAREGRGEHHEGRDMHGPEHRPGMGPGGEPEVMHELGELGVQFYPPPMLIKRAQKIGLTPDQVTKVRQEMIGMQTKTVDLHAKVEHAKIEVVRLLAADKIDEKAIDAQIDEAAKAESEMHKLHVGTMLRVRALLTPEQLKKLEEHEPKGEHEGPKPGAGAGGKPGAMGEADDDDDDDEDDDGEAEG